MYTEISTRTPFYELLNTYDETDTIETLNDLEGLRPSHRLHSVTLRRKSRSSPRLHIALNHNNIERINSQAIQLGTAKTEETILIPQGVRFGQIGYKHSVRYLNPPVNLPTSVANPTLKESGGLDNGGTDITSTPTGSITVAEGDEIFVWMGVLGASGNPNCLVPTDSFGDTGGSSWAQVRDVAVVGLCDAGLMHRRIGSSPSSSTITLNIDNGARRWGWVVWIVTGQHTTTPIAESGEASSSGATSLTPSIASITSGNLGVAGFLARNNTAITEDTDFTVIAEDSSGGSNEARVSAVYDANDDETDCLSSWSSSNNCSATMAEIAQAAAGGGSPVALMLQNGLFVGGNRS